MANKDDFDVDDINFDNIDMDGWGDSDGLDFDNKDSRSAITKFALKAAKSSGAAAKDLNNQLRILKRALPKEYHGALDFVDKSRSAASSVYGNALDKLKPISSDVKEFARGVAPSINKLLPSKLRKRLDDWIDSDNDYSGYSGEDREGDIANNLQEIFALNTKEALRSNAEARKYRAVKEKIDHDRHVDQRTISADIRKGISRLTGYQDNITYKYQKKHLELEYRQLYVARDILTATQKGNENVLKALAAIGKNTGLPDAVKLQNMELFGLKTKESLIKKIQDRSFGGIGNMVDRMATNLGGMINNAIDILGMATSQLGLASARFSMDGGVGGTAASEGGAGIAVKLGEMIAGKIGGKYGGSGKVTGLGAKLNKMVSAGQSYMDDKARSGSTLFSFFSHLMATPQDNLYIKSRTDDLLKPVNFDGHTKAAVTDVIPGYLARILQQITSLRTGHDAPLWRYNLESGKWATDRTSKEEMKTNFARNSGGKSTAMEMERALNTLDPDNKLSPSARKVIGMRMLKDAGDGKAFYAKAYTRSDSYDAGVSRKDKADIINFMRKTYKAGRKVKLGDNVGIDNRHAEVSTISSELVRYIKPLRAELELQRALGNQDILEDMGFITVDSYGGMRWNMDKIYEFLAGNIDFEGPVNTTAEQDQQKINKAKADKIVEAVRSRVIKGAKKASASASQAWKVNAKGDVMTGKANEFKQRVKKSSKDLVIRVQDSEQYTRGRKEYNNLKLKSREKLNQLESVRKGVTRENLIADLSKVKSAIDKDLVVVSQRLENLNSIVKGDAKSNPALASVAEQINHIQADVNAALVEANLGPDDRRAIAASLKLRINQVTDAIKSSTIGQQATQSATRLKEKASVIEQRYASDDRTPLKEDYTGVPSELVEISREILKNTAEIRDVNVVMAKLLEGGLKVNGIYAERGGLYRGLRSGIGKLFSGAGGLVGGTMKFYGKSLGGIGSLIGGTARGVLNIGGGILGKLTQGLVFKDLYLPGNPQPVITARELRLGILFDDTNNKPIKSLKDIKGGVYRIVNNEREYVVTAGDAKRLITIQGKNLFKATLSGIGKFYGALLSPVAAVARVAAWGITGTAKFIFGAKDIYVKGETSPRLLASLLMNGGYFSSITRKPIRSVKDFAGDVWDQHGNVVLSVADMQKGLVDRKGNPYFTRGDKILNGIGAAANWLLVKPVKLAAWMVGKSYKALVGTVKMAGRIGLTLGKMILGKPLRNVAKSLGYSQLIRKNPDLIINAHTNEILLMIAELLNERLGSRTGGAGDADGDGLRDSSWASRIKNMRRKATGKGSAEEKKLSSIDDSLKKLLKKDFGGGGGLMGMAGNMIGKVLGNKWIKALGIGGLGATLGGLFGGGAGAATAAGGIGAAEAAAGGAGVAAAAKGGKLARGAAWLGRGLMAGGGMLGRGLMSGGGLLARGALMAVPAVITGLGAAATAIGAVISAPVVLTAIGVAVAGAGAYYLYKRFAKKENVFTTLRMAQYGIDMSEKDRVEKVLQLEKFVQPRFRFKDGDAQFAADADDAERIASIFGINRDDKAGVEGFIRWYSYRFKPTYFKHAITAFNQTGKAEPAKLDELDKKTKQDVLRGLRIPENGQNYQLGYSPFQGKLTVDFEKTEILYSKMDKIIEDSSSSSGEKKEAPKERSWVDKLFGLNKPEESAEAKPMDIKEQMRLLSQGDKQAVANVKAQEDRLNAARDATVKNAVNGRPGAPTGGVFVQPAPASNPGKNLGDSVLPASGSITPNGNFGLRDLKRGSKDHKGIDINAKAGSEIYAFAAGVITRCNYSATYGNVIYIKHDNGTESRYAHMVRFQQGMMVGKRVNAGDIIGYVGATGTVDGGAHLHFEIRDASGNPIDPASVLKDKNSKLAFLAGKKNASVMTKADKLEARQKTVPGHPPAESSKPSESLAKVNTAPVPKSPVKATTVAYNPNSKSRATEVVEQQRTAQTTRASTPRTVNTASEVDYQQLAVLTESLSMHRAIHERLGEIVTVLKKQDNMPMAKPSVTSAAVQGKRPLQTEPSANPVSMRRQS